MSGSLFDEICDGVAQESTLWMESLRPRSMREEEPVFSPLVPEPAHALGVETIYEGYLLHYGRSRLFDPTDDDIALLLGDTLLAQGLVRIAALGDVAAVGDLAELLSLCAQSRVAGTRGEEAAWAATAALLGRGGLEESRAALRLAGDDALLDAAARTAAGHARVDAAQSAHRRFAA